MQPIKIGVFCSSSSKTPQKYLDVAYELGQLMAEKNIEIWYGGGAIGAMGSLAEGMLSKGGQIIGVIPNFMVEMEWGNKRISQLIVCNDLSERKNIIAKQCDAFIALPGGTGTLDELVDIMSRRKLGLLDKPIVVVNIDEFYNPLIQFLQRMINDQLIDAKHIDFISLVHTIDEVLPTILNYSPMGKENVLKLAAL